MKIVTSVVVVNVPVKEKSMSEVLEIVGIVGLVVCSGVCWYFFDHEARAEEALEKALSEREERVVSR